MKKQLLVMILAELYKIRKEMKVMKQEIADVKAAVDAARAEFNIALANIAQDELLQSKKIDALLAQIEQSGSLTPEEKTVLIEIGVSARAMADATKSQADKIVDEPIPPVAPPTPIA